MTTRENSLPTFGGDATAHLVMPELFEQVESDPSTGVEPESDVELSELGDSENAVVPGDPDDTGSADEAETPLGQSAELNSLEPEVVDTPVQAGEAAHTEKDRPLSYGDFRLLTDALLETSRASGEATACAITELGEQVARFHERSQGHESNARLMHARIEELQQDQVRALLKPAFERLASLHAQASDIAAQKRDQEDKTAAEDFAYFADSIEDLMSLYDLHSVRAAAGDSFDARRHQASRAVKSADEVLDGSVQRVIRQGFGFAGSDRVFLPARVAVYRYELPADPEPSAPSVESAAVDPAILATVAEAQN